MAHSVISYTGTGIQTDFVFPFPYLNAGDISVFVDGVPVATTLPFPSVARVAAPANGAVVTVRRLTSKASVPVDFADGSPLLARDLDLLATWMLYVAQESTDNSGDSSEALQAAVAASASAEASADSALAAEASAAINANTTLTRPRYVGNAVDDAGTPDAVFRASGTLAGPSIEAGHAFRDDRSSLRASSYCSFDAAATVSPVSGTEHHYAGFQSRPVFGADIKYNYNFTSTATVNAGVTVTNNYGFYPYNPGGAGTILYNYGIFIPNQSKGTLGNWALFISNTAAKTYIGSDTQVNSLLRVGDAAQLVLGGSTTSDYPSVGYNFDPVLNQRIAADMVISAKFNSTGFQILMAPSGAAGSTPVLSEVFLVDTLGNMIPRVGSVEPTLTNNGQMAFVLTTDTNLRVCVRSGGVTRRFNWTLA